MKRILRKRPSGALVVAVVALFVALGGTAMAGGYVITRLGQIKPSVRHQLRGNAGPQGAQGAPGAQGAQGPQGPAGIPGVVEVESAAVVLSPDGVNGTYASCPAGDVALGGGWDGGSDPDPDGTADYDYPIGNNTAWDVVMTDHSGLTTTFAAVIECAPAPAGAAIAHVARSSLQRENAQAVAAVRARLK